jgi:hypothetical protein
MANRAKRRTFDFYALESRVLLSGDSIDVTETPDADAIATALLAEIAPESQTTTAAQSAETGEETEVSVIEDAAQPATNLEIIFVDSGIADSEQLISDLKGNNLHESQRLIFELSADESGIDQISSALESLSGVNAIHILSHGSGGNIQLGGTELNMETSESYAGQIATWGSVLDSDADLLIYGCGLADNDDGRELIESLATLCDCDVAASDDPTGHAKLGGDWDLEFNVGRVETSVAVSDAAQANWMSLLDSPAGSETSVANSTGSENKPDVAVASSGDFVVVWESDDNNGNGNDIFFQRYNANGTEQGSTTRANTTLTGDQNAPSVAIRPDGGFVVIWDGNGDQPGQSDNDGIFLQQYDSQGLPQGNETKVNSNNRVESDAAIAMDADGDFVIAWTSDETGSTTDLEIYLQRFDSDFTAQGSEIRVNTTTDQNQFAPTVAMRSDGEFVVTWEGNGAEPNQADTNGIFYQRFDSLAVLQGDETRVNATTAGIQSDADIAMNTDGTFVVTWAGSGMIYHQIFDPAGNAVGSESMDTNAVLGPYASPTIAMSTSDGFVIAYDGDENGAADDIYKTVFDSTGTKLSTTQVNTSEAEHSQAVVATTNDGGSIVAWQAVEASTGDDSILLQRYSAATAPMITDGILITANPSYELPILPSGTAAFDNQQIVNWNGDTAENVTGPSFSNGSLIDALSRQTNGNILLSVGSNTVVSGTLSVGHGDIIEYNPTTGDTSLFLKGSLSANGPDSFGNTSSIFLSNNASPVPTAENIDAFHLLSDGNILLSVEGTAGMDDGSGNRLALDDADLVLYDPTSNSASILFNFDGLYSGDINAITTHSSGLLSLSVGSNITLPNGDIFTRSDLFNFNHTSMVIDDVAPLEGRLHEDTPGGSFTNPGGGLSTPSLNAATWAAADSTANFAVAEGTTEITQISAITETGQSLTFSINGGVDASSFFIDSTTGALSFVSTPDFEAPTDADTDNQYEVTVVVTDTNAASDSLIATVTVTDIAMGGVTDINPTPNEVSENEQPGRTIGLTASASGDTVTYSLSDDDEGRFTIDPNTGVVTTAMTLDREVDGATRQIEISASDGTTIVSAPFNVSILPVNEHDPIIISGGGGSTASISVTETTTTVTSVVATDADLPAQTITYSITGGEDAASFTINPVSGLVEFNTAPDFESPADVGADNVYAVAITASDADGRTDTQILNITIDDLAVSIAGQQTNAFSGSSVTLSHETSGENRLMLVTVAMANHGDAVVNDLSYDSTALSLIGTSVYSTGSTNEVRMETWSLLAPALGTHDLVVNLSNPVTDGAIVGVLNFASVDQLDPLGNFVSSGDTSNTVSLITNSSNDDMVVSAIGIEHHGDYELVPGENQLELWDLNSEGLNFGVAWQDGGNSVTSAWTFNNPDAWSASALPIHAAVLTNTSPIITSNGGGNVAAINVDEWNTNTGPPPPGSAVTTITATDADVGQSLLYTIVGGNDADHFDLNPTNGQLAFSAAPDRENPTDSNSDSIYEVIVQVTDGTGGSDAQLLNITVNDVNEYTITTISDTDTAIDQVPENSITGTLVGVTALATDADSTATISYSLQDNSGGRFQIDATTGVVSVADGTLLDRETAASHNLTVSALSSDGSQSTQTYTVSLTDIDDNDVGSVTDTDSDPNLVQENASTSTATGLTGLATDPDPTATVTYDLQDNAGGRFQIDSSSGVVSVADGSLLDRELAASHAVTVRATSSDGTQSSTTFTIQIDDENEFTAGALSDTDVANNEVLENAATDSLVGITALATDDDATATVSYTLQDNAGGRFQVDSLTGVVTIADGTLLDREAAASHNLTVVATSSDGSQSTQTYTVQTIDVNEFGVGSVTDTDSTNNTVLENASFGISAGITANATDLDATNNNIIYSLADDDGGRFDVDQSSGSVFVAGSIDREIDGPVREITIRATSFDGSFTDQTFSIAITDINEFDLGLINDSDNTINAVDENSSTGTLTGIIASAIDADAENNTVTYSLDDTANERFSIDSVTGSVSVGNGFLLLDRENAATHQIVVRATSSDGSQQTQNYEIAINDVNEFTTTNTLDVDPAINQTNENSAIGTTAGIIANAFDADATQSTIIYSLDNDDSGRFSIDPTTGVVSVADGIDRESLGASSTIVVRSMSPDDSFTTASFEINIIDINEFDVEPGIDTNPLPDVVDENSIDGVTVGLTVNAEDTDSTSVVSYSLDDDANGRFTIDSSTGQVTALGDLDFETQASHTITVRAISNDESESTQSFVIQVQDVNEPPSASSDFFAKFKSTDGGTPGVLGNDTDIDGDTLSAILVDGPSNGRLVLSSNGSFTYTANSGFTGIDTFRYQASDGSLQSDPVLVQIEVLAPPPDLDNNDEQNRPTVIETLIGGDTKQFSITGPSTDSGRADTNEMQDKTAIHHLLRGERGSNFDPIFADHPRLDISTESPTNMNGNASDSSAAERSSWEATMLRELLELDLQQGVVWQEWDTLRETSETPPILYVVGSAGSAAGIISVGYLLWILRGSTVITVLTSSAPRWRMVDPTAILTAYRGSIDYAEDQMEDMLK